MNELKDNKLLLAAIVFGALLLGAVVGKEPFLDALADRVIAKFQKGYSPSPYGPGVDPDKVNPNVFQQQQQPPQAQTRQPQWQPQ